MDIHSKKLKLLILKISYSNFNRNLENRIRPLTKFERSSYARIPEHEANQSWNQIPEAEFGRDCRWRENGEACN